MAPVGRGEGGVPPLPAQHHTENPVPLSQRLGGRYGRGSAPTALPAWKEGGYRPRLPVLRCLYPRELFSALNAHW